MKHTLLIKQNQKIYLILFITVIVIIFTSAKMKESQIISVTIDEAHELITSNKNILIIDVRTYEEFSNGTIIGAINIPHNEIAANKDNILSKNKNEILVFCKAGIRSKLAAESLKELKIKKIYDMTDGYDNYY